MKKKLKNALLCTGLGMVAGYGNLLAGLYPLGVALLTATPQSPYFPFLFAGCVSGRLAACRSWDEILLALLPYALYLPVHFLLRKRTRRSLPYLLGAFACFAVPAILPVSAYQRLIFIFTGLGAAGASVLTKRLALSFEQLESRFTLEKADWLALGFLGAGVLSSLPRTRLWGFDLCMTALLASCSFACCVCGMQGSIWTSCCAVMWCIKGGDLTSALCLSAGGLLAGLLHEKRGGILLGFITGDMTVSLFILTRPYLTLGAINLLLGCFYPTVLPKALREKLKRLGGMHGGVSDREMHYINGMRAQQQSKLSASAVMFRQIADAFTKTTYDAEFCQKIVHDGEQYCAQCKKSVYCLEKRRADTMPELKEAAEKLIRDGILYEMPPTLTARCLHPFALVQAMNESFRHLAAARQENPDRETWLALQLKSVSEMLFSLADDLNTLPEFDAEKEVLVRDVLESRIGGVKSVICRCGEAENTVEIVLAKNTKDVQTRIVRALEEGFIGSYRLIQGGMNASGGFTGLFAPQTRFRAEAHACHARKEGEAVCGDAFTYGPVKESGYLAAISDGAGSGVRAARESAGALELLEAFSDTPIGRNEKFSTMNRLLLLKGQTEDYSTVDAAEFDLNSGLLYWTKIGAAPGYILHGDKAEKIEGAALPMGIVTSIQPAIIKKPLCRNDTVVLLSDGIYDGLCKGKEDAIIPLLTSLYQSPPKQMAEALLSRAQKTGHKDDMTVLVVKITA